MLKLKDQEKVCKIRENQVLLVDKLQSAEMKIEKIYSQIIDQNKKQGEIIQSIDKDITFIENNVDNMRNRIDNITTRILQLVQINEDVNKAVMNRQAAKLIEKSALEVDSYASKKKKDLQELKLNFNQI